MRNGTERSPAAEVMDEAIELALEERSPYPERALFLDAEMMGDSGGFIRQAVRDGRSLVLVEEDKSTRVLTPEEAHSLIARPVRPTGLRRRTG